jgi:hypothetical protein
MILKVERILLKKIKKQEIEFLIMILLQTKISRLKRQKILYAFYKG